jgi:hypothetical protein
MLQQGRPQSPNVLHIVVVGYSTDAIDTITAAAHLAKVETVRNDVHDGDGIVQSAAVGGKIGQMPGEEVGERPDDSRA